MKKKHIRSANYKAQTNSFFKSVEVTKLFRIYSVLRKLTSGIDIPPQFLESKWGGRVFKTLQDNILEYQKTTGIKVNPTIFIRTHFLVYGKDTYPNHLIAHNSFEIYRQYREQCIFTVKEDESTFESEMKQLEYLAKVRNESIKDTAIQLYREGLFSEKFLTKVLHKEE